MLAPVGNPIMLLPPQEIIDANGLAFELRNKLEVYGKGNRRELFTREKNR